MKNSEAIKLVAEGIEKIAKGAEEMGLYHQALETKFAMIGNTTALDVLSPGKPIITSEELKKVLANVRTSAKNEKALETTVTLLTAFASAIAKGAK